MLMKDLKKQMSSIIDLGIGLTGSEGYMAD